MPPSPVSKGLLDLLNQQKREAEYQRQQHQRDLGRQEQRWQQQRLWQQQQQQYQRENLRQQQRASRGALSPYLRQGADARSLVNMLKNQFTMWQRMPQAQRAQHTSYAAWGRMTKQEQKVLERLAAQGADSLTVQREMLKSHTKGRQDQHQRQGQARLAAHQSQLGMERVLTETHRRVHLSQREQHLEERHKQRAAVEQERAQHVQQRRRQQFVRALPHAALGGVRFATDILRIQQTPFLAREQRLHAAGESLAHFGGSVAQLGGKAGRAGAIVGIIGEAVVALIDFKRRLDGTAEAVTKLQMDMAHWSLEARKFGEVQQLSNQTQFGFRQQMNRRAAYLGDAGAGAGALPAIHQHGLSLIQAAGKRGTFAGELAYQQEAARFQPRVQLERARAEAAAARQTHEQASRQVVVSGANLAVSKLKRQQVEQHVLGLYNRDAPQKEITQGLGNKYKVEAEGLERIKTLQEDINRQREAAVTLAEKEKAASAAKANLLKAEQQILAQREQRQAHGAQAIGRMTLGQRAMAGTALNMLKKGMPVHLMPPAMRAALEGVAPQAMHKRYEQAGLGADLYKKFQQEGLIDKGDLAQTRREQAKIEAEVQVHLAIDEAEFAKKIAAAIGQHFKEMLDVVTAKIELQHGQTTTGQMVRNANQH